MADERMVDVDVSLWSKGRRTFRATCVRPADDSFCDLQRDEHFRDSESWSKGSTGVRCDDTVVFTLISWPSQAPPRTTPPRLGLSLGVCAGHDDSDAGGTYLFPNAIDA